MLCTEVDVLYTYAYVVSLDSCKKHYEDLRRTKDANLTSTS